MYVATVPNRNSPPAILLREAYREHGKVKNRTLANLSHWPPAQIEALRQVLKGDTTVSPRLQEAFAVVRSLPHGNVAVVLGMLRQLKLEQLLEPGPQRARVLALIAQRVLQPASKLATARALRDETPPTAPSARSWGWPRWTKTTSMQLWTGCCRSSPSWRQPWPAAIWARAAWCSTT